MGRTRCLGSNVQAAASSCQSAWAAGACSCCRGLDAHAGGLPRSRAPHVERHNCSITTVWVVKTLPLACGTIRRPFACFRQPQFTGHRLVSFRRREHRTYILLMQACWRGLPYSTSACPAPSYLSRRRWPDVGCLVRSVAVIDSIQQTQVRWKRMWHDAQGHKCRPLRPGH